MTIKPCGDYIICTSILLLFVLVAGYGQDNQRETKPFRLGMSVVISPNYYTQVGVDFEPTYMLIDKKLTLGLRYLGLWAISNITSSQSLSMVSDIYFEHKKFNFFFHSVGMGIGLFNSRDSVKITGCILQPYLQTISAS